MRQAGIQIRNLEFGYRPGGFRLRVDELDIAGGSRVAFVGRSGCGKTTLAHLIAGIHQPERGEIDVGGERIDRLPEGGRRAFRNSEIGFVFQEFELLDYLRARDNLLLPYAINRSLKRPADADARATELATSVGLADKLDRFPGELSGGERQRLAIARALITSPSLVIADEPTGNLDPETASEVIAELTARTGDATLIAITHDHSLLGEFDQVVDVSEFSIA